MQQKKKIPFKGRRVLDGLWTAEPPDPCKGCRKRGLGFGCGDCIGLENGSSV